MFVTMLKSKIHKAKVTDSNLEYEGSLGIPYDLMQKVNFLENEKIEVYNITNGKRFSTYIIKGKEESKEFVVNGAAAHLAKKGDKIIIASYGTFTEEEVIKFKPNIIRMDENNNIVG